MKEKYIKTKLGATVFLALVILFVTILWGKNIQLARSNYEVKALFPDVTGLEKGARVLVNGIPKGKVSDYYIAAGGVIVELNLEKDILLYDDAFAYLESPDLMGEKVVAINPGKSGIEFNFEKSLPGIAGVTFSQLFSSVDEIKDKLIVSLDHLNNTAISISAFVDKVDVSGDLNKILANLAQTSAELNGLVAENSGKMSAITDNLIRVSSASADFIDTHKSALDTIIYDLSDFSAELHKITLVTDQLSEILTTEESTAGRLLHDDDLYLELKRLTQNIDSLVTEIRTKGIDTHLKLF